MKKIAWKFGLIAGLVIAVYSALTLAVFGEFKTMSPADLGKVEMFGYVRYVVLIVAVVFGIREWQKQPSARLDWVALAKSGVAVALVVALFVGIFEASYSWLNPNFMDDYGQLYLQNMKNMGAAEAEIADFQRQMAEFAWMKNPLACGGFYFAETAIIGALAAGLAALFMRKA